MKELDNAEEEAEDAGEARRADDNDDEEDPVVVAGAHAARDYLHKRQYGPHVARDRQRVEQQVHAELLLLLATDVQEAPACQRLEARAQTKVVLAQLARCHILYTHTKTQF